MATQEERSAATRTKLLDATIACLSERGWAATTTTEIAQRAGVSRGAQLHHFPTKESLVVTAVAHLFEQRDAEFRAAFARLKKRGLGEAIELLWSMMAGPSFLAWLELVVAARTDDALRPAVSELSRGFLDRVGRVFRDLFPRAQAAPVGDIAPFFVVALLEGLALDRIALGDDKRIRASIDGFKTLATSLLGGFA